MIVQSWRGNVWKKDDLDSIVMKIPESQRDEIMQEYDEVMQGIKKSGQYRAGPVG
jgi:hypothetical protein